VLGRKIRSKTYDLGVVGHIVFDHISRGGRLYKTQLGSPCVYASLGARALDASVVVGSKVGRDLTHDHLRWLRSQSVNTDYVHRTNGLTTAFKISYENGTRRMWTESKCQPITRRDLANFPQSSSLHLGPILNEIPQSVALWLTERDTITSLDPQGYLRRTLRDGRVGRLRWRNTRLLKRLDVLKLSEDEAQLVLGRKLSTRKLTSLGPKVILITKGGSGTTMWTKEQGAFRVPAFKTRVRDPTGAGDALVGTMLVTWVRTGDLLWSVAVGSAVASFVVERVGPTDFGTVKQVQKRARVILDGAFKVHD
jgi:sugar/nucleoside kinase (ribokinase family)